MGTVVEDILANRAGKHGEFAENSDLTWKIMNLLMAQRNWPVLTNGQRHALYMEAHKIARIMVGDPNEVDHWDDMAGYATLVADRIRKPAEVYTTENDVYGAMAVGWGVSREEAKRRSHALMANARQKEAQQKDVVVNTNHIIQARRMDEINPESKVSKLMADAVDKEFAK